MAGMVRICVLQLTFNHLLAAVVAHESELWITILGSYGQCYVFAKILWVVLVPRCRLLWCLDSGLICGSYWQSLSKTARAKQIEDNPGRWCVDTDFLGITDYRVGRNQDHAGRHARPICTSDYFWNLSGDCVLVGKGNPVCRSAVRI